MNYSTETYRLSIRHFFKFRNSPYIYNKLLEYEIYSSLALKNKTNCTTKFATLHKTAKRSAERVSQ